MTAISVKSKENYTLPRCSGTGLFLARGWLTLGIAALALAGIFAILLVLARSPYFTNLLPHKDFFNTTLVIHVNLSVLVWLLSFIACLLSYLKGCNRFWGGTSLAVASFGALLMAASPFIDSGTPLLNNYVPIYQSNCFYYGLTLFLLGVGIHLFYGIKEMVIGIFKHRLHITPASNVRNALFFTALIVLAALVCFYVSYHQISALPTAIRLDNETYFDHLFWGGGHVLQFAYSEAVLIVWLLIASFIGLRSPVSPRMILSLLLVGPIILLSTPNIYLKYLITDFGHMDSFTQQMRWGGGLSTAAVGLFLFLSLILFWKNIVKSPAKSALFWSLLLYGTGGIIAMSIVGSNTKIPAHYHGNIIGVTLAFMGMTYILLPQLGFGEIHKKRAQLQPTLYGLGQLLHIIGLAISGGYGALRKTPGAMESIEGKLAMGLMGFGGMLSVVGGLLFVLVAGGSILKKRNT